VKFAADICEGLVFLKRREPDFEVMSAQCIGLMTRFAESSGSDCANSVSALLMQSRII